MLTVIIIIAVLLVIGLLFGSSNRELKTQSPSKTMEIDVPNPAVVSPEKFLDFVESTPSEQLWQVEQQLESTGLLKDIVLSRAIREKSSDNHFDKNKYLNIIAKIEQGNYSINEADIPENYEFCSSVKIAGTFISDRKEYIIFDLNEGEELTMKPEPYNTYDRNAIAIFHNKKLIGYVPAVDCLDIREMIRFTHLLKVADIVYKDDFIDVIAYLYKSEEQNSDPQYYLNHDALVEVRSRKIRSEFLKPKKGSEDINAFYKKKVVITGNFKNFPDRNDLAKLLYDSGADIDTCITERVSFMVAGEDAGWKKLEKAKEYDITIFNENHIMKIFDLKK